MKKNKSFGRLNADNTIEYAPAILRVITHHTGEYQDISNRDEVENEGAEPVYETKTYTWDTAETKLKPTAEEYLQMGWKAIDSSLPDDPLPEGKQWSFNGWQEDETRIFGIYESIDIPAPSLHDYDEAMENHLRTAREERGYTTREPDSYITSGNARWAQDAKDWVAFRDAVMEYALELVNAVGRGERKAPTMAEFRAGLPRIRWTIA